MTTTKRYHQGASRRGVDPVLASLRESDCVISLAARLEGPGRVRTSLSTARGRMEVGDDLLAVAEAHVAAVRQIADAEVRRVVVLAMTTDGCSRQITMRDVAALAGVPLTKAWKLLRRGLAELREHFDEIEQRAA